MKQLTRGVQSVMRMAERQLGAEPGGARPELVGRDAGGRFVGAGGNGSAEAMARMKIGFLRTRSAGWRTRRLAGMCRRR